VYLEDLIGEGNIALTRGVTMLKAVDEPGEVESFLTKMMMDAMEEIIADSLDEDARGQKAVRQVQEVADKASELAVELRRKVTVEELSKETGWTQEKIVEAVRMTGNKIEDIDFQE
jgi:RNA polymerase primary sigma factor